MTFARSSNLRVYSWAVEVNKANLARLVFLARRLPTYLLALESRTAKLAGVPKPLIARQAKLTAPLAVHTGR